MTNFYIYNRESGRIAERKKTSKEIISLYGNKGNFPHDREFSTENARINGEKMQIEIDYLLKSNGRTHGVRTYTFRYEDVADAISICNQIEEQIHAGVALENIEVH